jgi:hypothetical protein
MQKMQRLSLFISYITDFSESGAQRCVSFLGFYLKATETRFQTDPVLSYTWMHDCRILSRRLGLSVFDT